MRYLITGHTGFKGAWLIALLRKRGHEVHGASISALNESLFVEADLSLLLETNHVVDIRDDQELKRVFLRVRPDVLIHFAAQSLVPLSFANPVETYSTNVMGTINVLECIRSVENISASLIITSDKVYKNKGINHHYVEGDPLGGLDPYSASKAMADIATQSWIENFINSPTAVVRAGNVIGGGDYASKRLIPDLVRGYVGGYRPKLRSISGIRPWQNVLDCLNGYDLLVEHLIAEKKSGLWNFGPDHSQIKTVQDVVTKFESVWGLDNYWDLEEFNELSEVATLLVNSDKARSILGWTERYSFEDNIMRTSTWYKDVSNGKPHSAALLDELEYFEDLIYRE